MLLTSISNSEQSFPHQFDAVLAHEEVFKEVGQFSPHFLSHGAVWPCGLAVGAGLRLSLCCVPISAATPSPHFLTVPQVLRVLPHFGVDLPLDFLSAI